MPNASTRRCLRSAYALRAQSNDARFTGRSYLTMPVCSSSVHLIASSIHAAIQVPVVFAFESHVSGEVSWYKPGGPTVSDTLPFSWRIDYKRAVIQVRSQL